MDGRGTSSNPEDSPRHSRWMRDTEGFRRFLESGHLYAEKVGERLRESGCKVTVTPMKFRASVDEIAEYADELDVVIEASDGRRFIVESKSRDLIFGELPGSYPWPTAFVDTKKGFDQKTTKPDAVVLVSTRTDAMLVIAVQRTIARWTVEHKRDHKRQIWDDWYMVPKMDLSQMQYLIKHLASNFA